MPHYEINVAKNGKHYFATHERSIHTKEMAKEIHDALKKAFPKSEGYEITVYYYQTVGERVNFDFIHKDKFGQELKKYDSVLVPDPKETDLHQHSFVGFIKEFRNENVIVCDADDNCFEIEPERLEIEEDE